MKLYGQSVSSTAAAMYSVLNSLSRKSRDTGHIDCQGVYVFASRRQLGEYIERSERTAQRVISELKAAGLIRVRRMGLHSHDRIYIVNGVSEPVKNGGSEIKRESNKKREDISFYLDKTPAEPAQVAAPCLDDAKIADTLERIGAPAGEKVQDTAPAAFKNGFTQPKGKPTPKRPRATKAQKEAAKKQYQRALDEKLDMSNLMWLVPGLDAEYKQLSTLIDLIAEAVSVEGRTIRVNGATLTASQYWNMVQHVNSRALCGLFERLKEADNTIRDKRAYTLAAVYNAVQWDRLKYGWEVG